MFSAISRISMGTLNVTHYVAEQTVKVSCTLLVTASRACDYALSLFPSIGQELWEIGQGTLMTACGIATIAKAARSSASRRWRYPTAALGVLTVGVGIHAIINSVGRLSGGTLHERDLTQLQIQSQSRLIDAPHPFQEKCSAQDHKKILVMCHIAKGNGDLVHCKEMFGFLEDSFPAHRVEIGIPQDESSSCPKYFSPDFCKKITYLANYAEIRDQAWDLVVDCPIFVSSYRDVINVLANGTTPHLGVTEFDYYSILRPIDLAMKKKRHLQSSFFSSGLHEQSIGLPFDTRRFKTATKAPFNELERLKRLANVSLGLQKAILGTSYSDSAISKFHQEYSLYPSYTHYGKTKDAFFWTVLETNKLLNEPKSPCFVFVGKPPTDYFYKDSRFTSQKEFGRLDWFTSNSTHPDLFSMEQQELDTTSRPFRPLRIVQVPYLPHEDLVTLFGAARIGQATGDMTPKEMLEQFTPFIYELLDHKKEFAIAATDIARQFDAGLGTIVHDLMQGFPMKYPTDFWSKYSVEDAAHGLKLLIQKPETWIRFVKHLFEHRNSFSKIRKEVQRYLR